MASSINASLTAGLVSTADTSGIINLQSGGTTVATISSTGLTSTGGALNGTLGATTPSTVVATTISASNSSATVSTLTLLNSSPTYPIITARNTGGDAFSVTARATGGGAVIASTDFALANYSTMDIIGSEIRMLTGSSATERMRIDASGNLNIGTSGNPNRLTVSGTTTAQNSIYITPGAAVPSQIVLDNGFAARQGIVFGNNGSSGYTSFGMISENTSLQFKIAAYNIGTSDLTTGWTTKMTLDASGNLLVGKTVAASGVKGHYFDPDGTWRTSTNGTGASNHAIFINAADTTPAAVGSISTSGSTTTYATSSDYRLKENVQPMIGALSVVQALKPVTYSWKVDGSDGQGFIAHELQEVVPDAVVGEKDAVDADGNPQYQGIDTSFLVATLVAAIQELKAEIDLLKGAK